MIASDRTLILAWGNPARQDDGLGPEFARQMVDRELDSVTVATDYQLQIENAADVAEYERVIFVDADRAGAEPFWLRRLQSAERGLGFSTHSVTPSALLALARDLFDSEPEAWLMGIRGYEFGDFGEELSASARSNLAHAVAYLERAVRSDEICEIRPDWDEQLNDGSL